MATFSDFGITINGVDYSAYWASIDLQEVMASQAVIQCSLKATGPSDFTSISNGSSIQIFEYSSTGVPTLRFNGIISSTKRIGYNQMAVTGYDAASYALMNQSVTANAPGSVALYSVTGLTVRQIVNQLCSTNLTGGAPWLVTIGSVDNPSSIVSEFTVPMISRWDALVILAKKLGMELYTDNVTGYFNLVNHRGSTSSVFTYNLTGAATNAHSSENTFTSQNIINDVTAVGPGNLITRFQDFSPIYCKTAFSDARLTAGAILIVGNDYTVHVNSTENWPATGFCSVMNCRSGNIALDPQLTNNRIDIAYYSKTATTITGSISKTGGAIGSQFYADVDSPVLLESRIIVDDNSAFASSGYLLIGNEIIPYASKPSSTSFEVGTSVHRELFDSAGTVALLIADINDTQTTIDVFNAVGFPPSGTITIYSNLNVEIISYTSIVDNFGSDSFVGCTRGILGTVATSHQFNDPVFPKAAYTGIHPKGVLVYNYNLAGVPEAGSSIATKGRFAKTLRVENAYLIEDLEGIASRTLEQHRWGDQRAQLVDPNVFNFSTVLVGDKVTANDDTLSWSTYLLRVLAKHTILDRTSGYKIVLDVGSYADGATEAMLMSDASLQTVSASGAKPGTVANSGQDVYLQAGGQSADNQKPVTVSGAGAFFTSNNADGYVFTNRLWVDDTTGTAHTMPVYFYSLTVDENGNLLPTTSDTLNIGAYDNRFLAVYSRQGFFGTPTSQTFIGFQDASNASIFAVGSTTNINLKISAQGAGAIIVGSNILPVNDAVTDLGSPSFRFNNLYAVNVHFNNILPNSDLGGDLGSPTLRWANVYAENGKFDAIFLKQLTTTTYRLAFQNSGSSTINVYESLEPSTTTGNNPTFGANFSRWAGGYTTSMVIGTLTDGQIAILNSSTNVVNIQGSANVLMEFSCQGSGSIKFSSPVNVNSQLNVIGSSALDVSTTGINIPVRATNPSIGNIYFNTSDSSLRVFNGSVWKKVTLS